MIDIKSNSLLRQMPVLAGILCGIAIILSSFVIKPVYIILLSDVMYMDSWLLYVFEILITLLDIFIYSVIFATAIHFAFERKKYTKLLLICVCILVARIVADIIMTAIFSGYVSANDLAAVLIQLCFELLLVSLVYIFTMKIFTKGIKNPLQISAIFAGGLLSINNILSRIVSDIIYGAPASLGEALVMVAYYLSDVLVAGIAYIIIINIFKFFKKQSV